MSTIDGLNLTGDYYKTVNGNNNTNSLESKLNSNLDTSSEEELMKVCKEFEAYFTEQVFKQMEKMIPKSEESSSSSSSLMGYCKDNLTQEYASMSSETQGVGLAQVLYEQMKRNYNL
ncbi:rod-binding protein [Anaerosacchariphilus polymeriproducens]|uniref:Uncharacterized protein n=1 Tax=Anaerosacchariphilus polymeriproducens TaxID=1812858 RepID=A0A371ATD1_9FIRM|nr:rod-binding protein [Anaerosacchariphilus polymeriproducens]RDU22720.1 hypothetical protein DWV06_13195 [Anaerosacchariphilus polymeriproducens]